MSIPQSGRERLKTRDGTNNFRTDFAGFAGDGQVGQS